MQRLMLSAGRGGALWFWLVIGACGPTTDRMHKGDSVAGAVGTSTPAREGIRVNVPVPVGESAAPVAAVYVEDWGLASTRSREPQVIVAVWGDGRIVCSSNSLEGGPPYMAGRIDPQRLRAVLDGLDRKGVFDDRVRGESHYGPDSSFTTIAIADGSRRLDMASWHELYEANPKVVATSFGLTGLEGRNRTDVLAAEPKAYRHFRATWDEIRSALRGLIPAQGRPAGDLHFRISKPGE